MIYFLREWNWLNKENLPMPTLHFGSVCSWSYRMVSCGSLYKPRVQNNGHCLPSPLMTSPYGLAQISVRIHYIVTVSQWYLLKLVLFPSNAAHQYFLWLIINPLRITYAFSYYVCHNITGKYWTLTGIDNLNRCFSASFRLTNNYFVSLMWEFLSWSSVINSTNWDIFNAAVPTAIQFAIFCK